MMPRAMVLAAGLGMRMRPLTDQLPKPLVPVCGVPLIDRVLDWLAESGVQEAVVNAHYKASLLESHLASRAKPVLRLSHERELLDTGGGIKKALSLLGREAAFFSVNSDALIVDAGKPALKRLFERWNDRNMDALLLVHPLEKAVGYAGPGDFFVEEDGHIRRRGAQKTAPFVFTGVQILHPRMFADAPEGAFSLNLLYDRLMKSGREARARALIHEGKWLHVGDMQGLKMAEAELKA